MIKRRKRKPPIPKVKWCKRCGKHRVKFHHYFCESCWKKNNNPEDEITEF